MNKELVAWGDILQHKDEIPHDIDTLMNVKGMIEQTQKHGKTHRAVSLIELNELSKVIDEQLSTLKLPQTASQIGSPQLA
jgi:hypothetical protein